MKTPMKIPYSVVSGRVESLKPCYEYFRSHQSIHLKLIGCKPKLSCFRYPGIDVSIPVGSTSLCYFKCQFFSSGLGGMVVGNTVL